MKKFFVLCILLITTSVHLRADEGMWLLPFLEKMNIKDMKAKGFKLTAQDIYNINGNAIKDAIVIFGGGCTGEIVSAEGLILTNHHCGYGAIQQHSTVENDYLENGFWAMNRKEEIPTPGLGVTFIRRIEDVSDKILPQLNDKMTEDERNAKVAELSASIAKEAKLKRDTESASVKSFFGGNQYLMFITESYNDVRMVGAPPSSIGKFGGDTDNWMWPRHTGDFSVFRVYSTPDGAPAKYSADNVPYKALKHLTISIKDTKPNDFAMIIGFPGSTSRYMSSFEIDETLNTTNPNRIFIRGERQDILMKDMLASDKIRIQYSSKYAGSSNYWKNAIGKSRGLKKLHVKDDKLAIEKRFAEWVSQDPARKEKYGEALTLKENAVKGRTPYVRTQLIFSECLRTGTEILTPAQVALGIVNDDFTEIDKSKIERAKQSLIGFYKDYSPSTDRKVAKRMFAIVKDSVDKSDFPTFFKALEYFNGNVNEMVDFIYDNSVFANEQIAMKFMENPDASLLSKDPAVMLADMFNIANSKISKQAASFNSDFNRGHRLFIAGLMEMDADKNFYPDANFTMRLTYGQILPYDPQDAVTYKHFTTLSGVIAKEDPENAYEFTVPDRLKELYKAKDFGQYATNGDVKVGFISNNDITGGNSGSPVLNGKGELIGLVFDGNWEAMSGDIAFEPQLQRSISVDVRYVLFVIDKYAGARHLIDEMTIVK